MTAPKVSSLPKSAERLLAGYRLPPAKAEDFTAEEAAALSGSGDFILSILLEDGSSQDLRWLGENFAETSLVRWVEDRGQRQLSKRSLAFWQRVLGVSAQPPAAIAEALWIR